MVSEARKNLLSVVPVALGAAFVVFGLLWYAQNSAEKRALEDIYILNGTAVEVALGSQAILLEDDNGRQYLIELLPETRVLDEKGELTPLSYIQVGFTVSIKGILDRERSLVPVEIKVLKK